VFGGECIEGTASHPQTREQGARHRVRSPDGRRGRRPGPWAGAPASDGSTSSWCPTGTTVPAVATCARTARPPAPVPLGCPVPPAVPCGMARHGSFTMPPHDDTS